MAAKARWLRLSVDWDDSEWIDEMSGLAQLAWIKLLCHAKREGDGRHKIVSPKVAARKWRVTDSNAVIEMLKAAIADGALVEQDGYWVLTNWKTYQKPDSTNAERQKRHRSGLSSDNAVNPDHNAVTPSHNALHCHATETERLIPPTEEPVDAPFERASRVLVEVHAALNWNPAIPADVRHHLKPESPIQVLIAEFGEPKAVEMFLWAHSNWEQKPTWKSVFNQRNQIAEQIAGPSVRGSPNGRPSPSPLPDARSLPPAT